MAENNARIEKILPISEAGTTRLNIDLKLKKELIVRVWGNALAPKQQAQLITMHS